MKTIPDVYNKDGYERKFVERSGNYAIYRQSKGTVTRYEVMAVRNQKAGEAFGVKFEAGEKLPTSREWGAYGWTLATLERARVKVAELIETRKGKI